jgi:hypothetical protein
MLGIKRHREFACGWHDCNKKWEVKEATTPVGGGGAATNLPGFFFEQKSARFVVSPFLCDSTSGLIISARSFGGAGIYRTIIMLFI